MKKTIIEKFKDTLSNHGWSVVKLELNPHTAFTNFYKIDANFEQCFPYMIIREDRNNTQINPWMSIALLL